MDGGEKKRDKLGLGERPRREEGKENGKSVV